MLLGEPPASQADLHFRVFGFPVRVHPFFWVVALFMGLGSGRDDPQKILIWVGVVFVSVLLHEMGHASIQRLYGGHPWITLYGLGGLASCNDGPRSPGRRILVLLAGPGAGFLLAAVVLVWMKLAGHAFNVVSMADWNSSPLIPENATGFSLFGKYIGYFPAFASDTLTTFVRHSDLRKYILGSGQLASCLSA